MPELMESWKDFNVAMLGATAALAGLLIVAMSVNIADIVKTATLPARAAAAIGTLVVGIVATALGLVPAQPGWLYGLEVVAAALVATVLELHAVRTIFAEPGTTRGQRIAKSVDGMPILAFLAGGALLVVGEPSAGLAFLAAGSVLAVVAAILYAWIVLVEVLR